MRLPRSLWMTLLLTIGFAALEPAAASETVSIGIEAQPLATALREFARQSGIQVAVEAQLIRDKRSATVHGELEPFEALVRLLQGSRLEAYRVNDNTFGIGRPEDVRRRRADAACVVCRRRIEPTQTGEYTMTTTHSSRERCLSTGVIASLWCALVPTLALAQQSETTTDAATAEAPAATDGLQEIVVTATRRAESVQDVPYNIQAISSGTLEKIGALDQRDFARLVPGLSMVDTGARNGVDFVLRGLTTGGNANTTSTYVDETQVNLYTGLLDLKLIDVDRIEVLRGPQGTLYGGGSIGGTIRYISTKPAFNQVEGRVGGLLSGTAHAGTNYDATGMLNLPVVEDKAAIRMSVGYFDNDGYIDNVRLGNKGINWDRTLSGRFAFLARPFDGLDIELTHYYQRGKYGDFGEVFDQFDGLEEDTYGPPGRGQKEVNLTNLTVSYDLSLAKLTSSTSYVHETGHGHDDNTFYIRDTIFASFLPPEIIPEVEITTDRKRRSREISEEVRLVSQDTGRWNWLVGGYWYDRRAREILQEHAAVPFPGQAEFEEIIGGTITDGNEYFFTSDPTTLKQWAAFGELGYAITDRLHASLGLRYFKYKLGEDFYAIDQFFGEAARNPDGTARTEPFDYEYAIGRASDDGTIYRFNASYDLTDDDLVYVTVAEGYRPGGFNLITPNTGVPESERQYDPDSITSYEVGAKLSLLDHHAYLSTAVYYIDWQDIQTTIMTDLGFTLQGNAGKATARGFELELQTRDLGIRGLSFGVGYSYTYAKLAESIPELGFNGDRVPTVPKHSGFVMADYEFPVAAGWMAGLTLSTTYTGTSFSTFGPVRPDFEGGSQDDPFYLRQENYWLSTLSVRLSKDQWDLRLFADNLFDKRATLSRTYNPTDSPFRSPFYSRDVARPRTVGIEVTRSF